tara:strand:+ start:9070 stop:9594 length:525 start_codon:yes stop_codon:yes gene_type:complete
MSKKVIYGIYDDDDVILQAVKDIREKGLHVDEVYSPFPIHGLDHAMGLKPTRLAITAFIYGCIGLFLGLLMMWYMMIIDWPMIIGGKPNFTLLDNLPAFVPIAFEITVFFASHLMVITYLVRCQLFPGSSASSPDPRTTDDKFLMEILVKDNEFEIISLMKETGAIEVKDELID